MDCARAGDLDEALAHFKTAQNQPDNLGVGRGMSLYDVLAWFKAAETLRASGKAVEAREYYQKVITAENSMALWDMQTPLSYYAALSLRALGQEAEADQKLQALQDFARKKLGSEEAGGFFTSKPAMIVFDDDPKISNQIDGQYLLGLAQLGLGNAPEAEASFRDVLNRDPHHWWAKFQLAEM
jgi:tetratricopeptide (TPR) repeat protein